MRRTASPSHRIATARSSVARASPTLPPSAISASDMFPRMTFSENQFPLFGSCAARAQNGHADIVENRGDRRMPRGHGDPHGGDARERRQDLVGDRAGGGLDQAVAL